VRQLCAAMHSGVRHGHLTSFVVFGQQSNKESGPIVHAVMYINNSGLGRGDSHHTTARLLRKRSRWHILGLANRPPMTVGPLCTSSVCAVSSTRECMVVACTWLNSSSRNALKGLGSPVSVALYHGGPRTASAVTLSLTARPECCPGQAAAVDSRGASSTKLLGASCICSVLLRSC